MTHYRFEEGPTNHAPVSQLTDSGPEAHHGWAIPGASLHYATAPSNYPVAGSYCLALFGNPDGAIIPHPFENDFTIEFFFRPFEGARDPYLPHTLLTKRASDDPNSEITLAMEYIPARNHLYLKFRTDEGMFSATADLYLCGISEQSWSHVAMFWKSGIDAHWGIYRNGFGGGNSARTDTVAFLGTGPLYLGACDSGQAQPSFRGLVDELRISNVARTPWEGGFLIDPPHWELPYPPVTIKPQVELSWLSAPDAFYQVEWADRVDTNRWTVLTNLPGNGFTLRIIDPGGFGQQRFYQVRCTE